MHLRSCAFIPTHCTLPLDPVIGLLDYGMYRRERASVPFWDTKVTSQQWHSVPMVAILLQQVRLFTLVLRAHPYNAQHRGGPCYQPVGPWFRSSNQENDRTHIIDLLAVVQRRILVTCQWWIRLDGALLGREERRWLALEAP
jgi:hypothetical protein